MCNVQHIVTNHTESQISQEYIYDLPIKSVSNTLSCCCFVCAFIIGQCHSGDSMSSKTGAAGTIFIFESEKCHGIHPLKTDTLTVSTFDAVIHVHDESKHYLSH